MWRPVPSASVPERKMTARMQAAVEGASLVLLRTSDDAGHGGGTPLAARIQERAEIDAFLLDRLTPDDE